MAKTVVALLLFWFIFLFLVPLGISIVEIDLGIQRFPAQQLPAGTLLLASTLFGMWAALTVAVTGSGTPVPFDAAREFVVSGPYAYLRYPLVLAAFGQVVSIGLAFGSVPVLVYATAALVLWYYVVRPASERDLAERFGEAWRDYSRAVRGFRPRLTPYRPPVGGR